MLFAAVALLALLGLLLAAAAASISLAGRSAKLAESASGADEGAAEFAANSSIGRAGSAFALADLPFGEAKTFDVSSGGSSNVRSTVTITRLRDGLYDCRRGVARRG